VESGEATASQACRRRVEPQRVDAEAGARQARRRQRVEPSRTDVVRGWSNDGSNDMTRVLPRSNGIRSTKGASGGKRGRDGFVRHGSYATTKWPRRRSIIAKENSNGRRAQSLSSEKKD
jgi:hypothetical protein